MLIAGYFYHERIKMQGHLKKPNISVKKRKWRKQNLPRFSYNPSLPITDRKGDIIDTIKKNQVVIISGETGSGKTTQIPKFCLAAGRGLSGKIGCTQPRRIAAITVANRLRKNWEKKSADRWVIKYGLKIKPAMILLLRL